MQPFKPLQQVLKQRNFSEVLLKEKSDSSLEIVEIFVFGENICDRLNNVPTYTAENEEVTLHNKMLDVINKKQPT